MINRAKDHRFAGNGYLGKGCIDREVLSPFFSDIEVVFPKPERKRVPSV
jgi:hypothetical protein